MSTAAPGRDGTAETDLARRADDLDRILRPLTGTGMYRNNAFRVTGVPTTASPTVIRRRRAELTLSERLGVPYQATGDLPPDPAPDVDAVKMAFETLRDPVARLIHEMLWLWQTDAEHDAAVRAHCAVLEEYSPTDHSAEDFENDPRAQRWADALRRWSGVLDAERTWERARERVGEIDDPRLTTGVVRRLRERLPRHLIDVSVALAVEVVESVGPAAADWHLRLLDESPLDDDLIDAALRGATRPLEARIAAACATAEHAAAADGEDSAAAGWTLVERATPALAVTAALLGDDDPVSEAASDQVARTLNRCATTHLRSTSDTAAALALLTRAGEMARLATTIELVGSNRDVVAAESVTGSVADLITLGRVNSAADRLRAWRRRTADPAVRRQLDAVLAEPRAIVAPPPRGGLFEGFWFIGFSFVMGSRALAADGTFVTTHYAAPCFVPIPMASYLRDETYYYGKVPLTVRARIWRLVVLLGLVTLLVRPYEGATELRNFLVVLALAGLLWAWRAYRLHRFATEQVGR
ncbi:hypothetical protein [Nocardia sp. N2S4-5]|uniref:hypothetical protein n=1 Tax=Nocardia sp. N2S4-5 TaxID=3351565 RepID=UPI0037D591E8